MERLLRVIRDNFDLSRCVEFTVEGGRPDTLDLEKLQTIRSGGADRMSINPQTMEDAVLRACGRPHKAADVLRAYGEAGDAGFGAINMDLIAQRLSRFLPPRRTRRRRILRMDDHFLHGKRENAEY